MIKIFSLLIFNPFSEFDFEGYMKIFFPNKRNNIFTFYCMSLRDWIRNRKINK